MLKQILYVLLGIVLINAVWAEQEVVDIDFLKEGYGAGETVQAIISTEPLERALKAEQFELYVNDIKKPIAPFFTHYSVNSYLLYFDLPMVVNGPVYLKVEKILYKGSEVLKEIRVEKEITIVNDPLSVLSIIPAFVVLGTNQKEFQIQIENKKGSTGLNITASSSIAHPYSEQLQTVNLNGKRIFKFKVDQTKLGSDAHITLNHNDILYTIPVMQRQEIAQQQPQPSQTPAALTFIATKSEVKQIIQPGIVLAGTLSLKNQGNTSLDNISLALVGNIRAITTIDTTFIPSLEPQQSVDITLTINQNRDSVPFLYEGVLQAATGTETASFPLSIEVQEETSGGEINATEVNLDLKQNELPDDGEQNPLNINLSKPTPQQAQKEYPLGLIIVTLFILGILIAFYVLKKKKPIKEETFDEYIKKIRK